MFIDSHCHLNYPELADDLGGVIKRAQDVGVKEMLAISTSLKSYHEVLGIAERYPFIYASFGIHPHDVDKEDNLSLEEMILHTQHPKVVGVGETGLDFYYDHSDRKTQEESFLKHLELCRITKLPIIVHTRSADERTLEILKDYNDVTGVIHCFTGSKELAYGVLDLGYYISISGIVTFKKAEDLQAITKLIPEDRLLIETDSPYLAPIPMRGKSNEPSYLYHTAIFIAALRNMSLEALGQVTTANFYKLFSKALKP
jgi:TatD DNase family protein